MPTTVLTIEQLKRAVAVSEQIEQLRAELVHVLGGTISITPVASPTPVTKGKRKMSAAARAKIAAAQRARWAKTKGKKVVPAGKPKKKGGMSAAGRAAIVAAQKARWAKVKAAKAGAPSAKPKATPKKKAKRNISPEARARMVAAVKRRWAKQKAGKAPTAASMAKIAAAGQPSFKVL